MTSYQAHTSLRQRVASQPERNVTQALALPHLHMYANTGKDGKSLLFLASRVLKKSLEVLRPLEKDIFDGSVLSLHAATMQAASIIDVPVGQRFRLPGPVSGWRLTRRLPLWRRLISTATCFYPVGAWACSRGGLQGTTHRCGSIAVQSPVSFPRKSTR